MSSSVADARIFFADGQIVRLGHGVYRGTDHGMVYRLFYQLTKKIYFEVSSTQTLDVVLSCSDRHVL